MRRAGFKLCACAVMFSWLMLALSSNAQFTRRRPDTGPKPKNIHGIVQDLRGQPLAGAKVFVRDMKTNVVRTLTVDPKGLYSIFALSPSVDYEVHAEFLGAVSDKKVVSTFLNREDNVLNFQLDVAVIPSGAATPSAEGSADFKTFDLVDLRGTFDMPSGIPAPVPSVLLLHGYGEDRTVWNDFKQQLLSRGWAVMTLDLRGHGRSTTKNGAPIQATAEWRMQPLEFPQDIDPALDWLKARPRIDTGKIVVIGFDVGANLALIASAKFPEVKTIVAIKPSLTESLSLAGGAQDFRPRSALIMSQNEAEGNRIKQYIQAPVRVEIASSSGGAKDWLAEKKTQDAIFQWLRETF